MTSGVQTKSVLVVALGGSGRKTAVYVSQKYSNSINGLPNESQLNLKVVSIDFQPVQWPGYLVSQEDYVPLFFHGMNLIQCWEEFEKERKIMTEKEEAWMGVGPITESELWLARDAQQSGIRRVDYFLLIHMARKRIEEKLRTELSKLLELSGPDSSVEVIIVGSLVGRTGSISYIPVVKILDSLAADFRLLPSYSFLYAPQAFHMRVHPEHEFNFLQSLASIRRHFLSGLHKNFALTQFLVEEPDPLLTSYGDEDRALPYSETIESIKSLIELNAGESTSGESFEEWLRYIKSVDISEIEAMAEKNKQINRDFVDHPLAIPQNWNANSLDLVFANLGKSI